MLDYFCKNKSILIYLTLCVQLLFIHRVNKCWKKGCSGVDGDHYKLPPSDFWNSSALSELSLGMTDVEDLIKKYDEEFGTILYRNLQSGAYENKERQALVRVVIDEVVRMYGNCYPPKEVLISVAKSIVAAFPALKSSFREGYEHFCDPDTGLGYLSFRLKNMRKYLCPGKKKRSRFVKREIDK